MKLIDKNIKSKFVAGKVFKEVSSAHLIKAAFI